jgi:hypothetical protein
MPRKPPTYNMSDIKKAIKLFEATGKTVTAIKFHPDGTFRLMTSEHVSKSSADLSPADNFDAWVARHAGSTQGR